MKVDRFDSRLGEVAITSSHIERDVKESENWERIQENFSNEKLVEYIHFKDLEDIELDKGSIFPNIKLKVDGSWKRLFFLVGDDIEVIFKHLNYRWHSYQENN